MKIRLILIVLSFLSISAKAQDSILIKKRILYGGFSIASGSGMNIAYFFSKNNGLNISGGIQNSSYKYTPIPLWQPLFNGNNKVRQYSSFVSVSCIKKIPINHPTIRFGTELGASWVHFKTPLFEYYSGGGFLGGNGYKVTDYRIRNGIGLKTRVSIDFLFSKEIGLEIAVNSNINGLQSYVAFEGNIVFGRLR
ncbi:hypothetical protein AD998_20050 [bacterium 336/3]|nr:hypothetical protein AD998_20050 [bacterium 336/3]